MREKKRDEHILGDTTESKHCVMVVEENKRMKTQSHSDFDLFKWKSATHFISSTYVTHLQHHSNSPFPIGSFSLLKMHILRAFGIKRSVAFVALL